MDARAPTYDELSNTVVELRNTVVELRNTVVELRNTIDTMDERYKKLEARHQNLIDYLIAYRYAELVVEQRSIPKPCSYSGSVFAGPTW